MNKPDSLKALRMQKETGYISQEFVEEIANRIIGELVTWTNDTIFTPRGGELRVNIPAFGGPNARAITPIANPLHPIIEIRLSMLIEIYRDAFTFPLISKRIETETTTIKNFHEADDRFLGKVFTFDSGIPIISDRHISGPLKIYSLAMADLIEKKEDPRIGKNEVYCRFFMFELMLVWTFFHELSHILQRHYMLNFIKCSDDLNSVAIEEINDHNKNNPDINAQAREILADVEGLDLTLKYLGRTDRITYVSMYLLLCSIGCMFQRFYRCYNEDLNLADGQHPHPVIRDEASNTFCIKWIGDHLVSSGFATELKDIALPLIYSSVRASIFTGLFRAHRIEEFNGAGLPSYMTLQSEAHQIQRNDYLEKLRSAIDEQSPHIKKLHLLSEDSFESILSHL